MTRLFQRLRGRKLVQWALAYLAGAWLTLQLTDIVGQQFGWPTTLQRSITVLLAFGLPTALVIAWYHGEKGAQRAQAMEILMLAGILGVAGAAVVTVRDRATHAAVEAGALGSAGQASAVSTIAVLPFTDLSQSEEGAYFAEGIAEDVLTTLTPLSGLRVLSRSATAQFENTTKTSREIGEELGAAHLLRGSVRRWGDSIRISAQLVDARTSALVWADTYDRDLRSALVVHSAIAQAIVSALRATLAPGERATMAATPQTDPQTYALYLQARYLWNQRTEIPQAIEIFERVIARDSTFAPAYVGLAQAWQVLPAYSDVLMDEANAHAREAVQTALLLDNTLSEAHTIFGGMEANEWRWASGERHFRRALELNPGDATAHAWYAELLLKTGRIEQAIDANRIALQLNPVSAIIGSNLGWSLYAAGRYQAAATEFESARLMNPRMAHIYDGLGSTYLEQRKLAESLRVFRRADELSSGADDTQAYLARGLSLSGERGEAEAILAKLKARARSGPGSAWAVALVEVTLGRNEEALDWLERALERREYPMPYLKVDPAFAPLRSHPRFGAVLRAIGLS